VHHVSKGKLMGREFKTTLEFIRYEMDDVILGLRSHMNILSNKSWELMGKKN
jgi:hypothetical protein